MRCLKLLLCWLKLKHTGGASSSCAGSHYNDVTTSATASQITSLTIVYSTVYSGADQRKQQCSASLAVFPAQRASNAENVSIWWRHHANEQPSKCHNLTSHACQRCVGWNRSSNLDTSLYAILSTPTHSSAFDYPHCHSITPIQSLLHWFHN